MTFVFLFIGECVRHNAIGIMRLGKIQMQKPGEGNPHSSIVTIEAAP